MLIDVFAGRDMRSAASRGCLHFAHAPRPGEVIEVDGMFVVVTKTWHRPDIRYSGAKLAILVEEQVGHAHADVPVRSDTEAIA
jgi:hypothetical protein